MCNAYHLYLFVEAHSGLLEYLPEVSVDDPHGGKVLDTVEPHLFELLQKYRHQPERISTTDACQHGCIFHDRQHFPGHINNNFVGVSIGQNPGSASPARHSISAGVINDDDIYTSFFSKFG